MSKKLLVITAGTVAAGVGQEILKQMKAHPHSDLDVMVRYIDTAFLPNRYGSLRVGQWFQMSIDHRYMSAIYKKIDDFPLIKSMLFPGLLPGTDVSGGGSIRYNGAGAVEVQRDNLRKWLSESMAEFASRGTGSANVSIALIVSAVGATGSGSLEHLVEVIVDAAYHAGIKSTAQNTIRCDVFILQPGKQQMTDLGLANTLALYAELAASQKSLTATSFRHYQGRKIMVGWGSNFVLSSIDQLKESAATLLRLTTDTSSAFSAEFQEREVDNHVLRELDPLNKLPMHLSTASVVTINLGNLVEQVIQNDVARLIDSLVFGKLPGKIYNHFQGLLGKAVAGESSQARYARLLDYIAEAIDLSQKKRRLDDIAEEKGSSASVKATRLNQVYESYLAETKQGNRKIEIQGRQFIDFAREELEHSKHELISQGYSLLDLREEFAALETVLNAMLAESLNDVESTKVNSDAIRNMRSEIGGSRIRNVFGGRERLEDLVGQMKNNLQGLIQEMSREMAFTVLDELLSYCSQASRNLDVVLNKLKKQKDQKEGWAAAYRDYNLGTGHPLHMVALSTQDEIKSYTEKVSIFSARARTRASAQAGMPASSEQLVDFRRWLEDKLEFEALFEGDVDRLTRVATMYVSVRVKEEVSKQKVVDVLLQAGDGVLLQRFIEAAARAMTLVSFARDFAPDLREAWHVSVDYSNNYGNDDPDKREKIDDAMKEAFTHGQCSLLKSSDPSEIAIYYYVDGLPMSAVDDLKGRCLHAFLKRRQQWIKQQESLNANKPVGSIGSFNQRVGVPVYSGQDAEERVKETCVIHDLYEVKGEEVGDFSAEVIPELGCDRRNGHHKKQTPDMTEFAETVDQADSARHNGNGTDHTQQPDPSVSSIDDGSTPPHPASGSSGTI